MDPPGHPNPCGPTLFGGRVQPVAPEMAAVTGAAGLDALGGARQPAVHPEWGRERGALPPRQGLVGNS